MTIHVTCSCGMSIAARDELSGKKIDCHTCGKSIQVPKIAPATPQASAGGGSAAAIPKWLMGTTVATALAAVGGGVMGVQLNNRVGTLAQTVSDQAGELTSQASALDAREQVEQELHERLSETQAALSKLGQDVEGETEELTAELGSLQTELEEATTQQAEHEDELAQLQNKTTKLRGEIEAAEEKIAAEMQTKADGFDKRVTALRDEVTKLDGDYQTAMKDTAALEKQMAQAKKDIALLTDGILAVNSKIPDTKPIWAEIARLQSKVAADDLPWYKTVFGENQSGFGDLWCAVRLDTRNGRTFVRKKLFNGTRTSAWVIPSPVSVNGNAGRFDVKLTFATNGDIHDAVMLDTHTGSLWVCDVKVAPRNFVWNPVLNFFQVNYGVNDAWRLDVDASNASDIVPRILLTDTTQVNRTYADDFSPRGTVLPLF